MQENGVSEVETVLGEESGSGEKAGYSTAGIASEQRERSKSVSIM